MLKLNSDSSKKTKGRQYAQLSVIVAAMLIGGFLLIRYIIWPLIWWIVPILSLAVLVVNWKFLLKLFKALTELYRKNVYLAIATTVAGFLAFTPFVGFLFVKTIWDFRRLIPKKKDKAKKETKEPVDMDATILDMDDGKELIKSNGK